MSAVSWSACLLPGAYPMFREMACRRSLQGPTFWSTLRRLKIRS